MTAQCVSLLWVYQFFGLGVLYHFQNFGHSGLACCTRIESLFVFHLHRIYFYSCMCTNFCLLPYHTHLQFAFVSFSSYVFLLSPPLNFVWEDNSRGKYQGNPLQNVGLSEPYPIMTDEVACCPGFEASLHHTKFLYSPVSINDRYREL